MKYAKIIDGIVELVQPFPEAGFVEVPDDVRYKCRKNVDGTFSEPTKSAADLEIERILAIKKKAHSVIITKYPLKDGQQNNLLAYNSELTNNLISLLMSVLKTNNLITPEIQTQIDIILTAQGNLTNIWDWVKQVRAVSNQSELAGTRPEDIVWPN